MRISTECNSATIVFLGLIRFYFLCWKLNESLVDLFSQRFDLSLLCGVDQVVNI